MQINTNLSTNLAQTPIARLNKPTSLKADLDKSDLEVLGYKIDKDGYLTSEFNKVAGIPDDYKIHSDTMISLVKAENTGIFGLKEFKSVDIAKSIGNAYKIVNQTIGSDILSSKQSFTKEDILSFPQGYEYDNKSLSVKKVYSNIYDYAGSRSIAGLHHSTLFYNDSILNPSKDDKLKPSTDIFNNFNNGKAEGAFWDTTSSKYTNQDGSITKGGLLVAALNANIMLVDGETTYLGKINGRDRNLSQKEIGAISPMTLGISLSDIIDDNEGIKDIISDSRFKTPSRNLFLKTLDLDFSNILKEGDDFQKILDRIARDALARLGNKELAKKVISINLNIKA